MLYDDLPDLIRDRLSSRIGDSRGAPVLASYFDELKMERTDY